MADNQIEKRSGAAEIISKLVLEGDLSKLSPSEKVEYYSLYCDRLGLNPLTRPFQIIKFEGKEVMYPTKDCTEQLRKINEVSIIEVTTQELRGLFVVTAKAKDKTGKIDVSTAAIPLTKEEKEWVDGKDGRKGYYKKTGVKKPVEGEELANLLMKTETKAKRRVTLSICGLGSIEDNPGGESFLAEKINPDDVVYRHEEPIPEDKKERGEFCTKSQVEKVTALFEALGILKGDLKNKIGKELYLMTQNDYNALGDIYKKIKGDPKTALSAFTAEKFIIRVEIKESQEPEKKEEEKTTQDTTTEEVKKDTPPEKKPLI